MNETNKNKKLVSQALCIISSMLVGGFLVHWLAIDFYKPRALILDAGLQEVRNLPPDQKSILDDLVLDGRIVSSKNLLENFTAYYHTLISLLIGVIFFLAGLVLWNFNKSKVEQHELMRLRLDDFIEDLKKDVNRNGLEALDEYEELQNYLKERTFHIIQDWYEENEKDIRLSYKKYIEEDLLSILDQGFIDEVSKKILSDKSFIDNKKTK